MIYDSEDKAAYILFTRAIDINPLIVTKDDLHEFLSDGPLTDYEQDILNDLGNPESLAREIIRGSNVKTKSLMEVVEDDVIASYNRSALEDMPDEMRKLIEEKRRELLEKREDDNKDDNKLDDNRSC
jgi:hypothetical protein